MFAIGSSFQPLPPQSIFTLEKNDSIQQHPNVERSAENPDLNLKQQVEQQKALSLAYQLMKAIARERGDDAENTQSSNNASIKSTTSRFELEVSQSSSLEIDISAAQRDIETRIISSSESRLSLTSSIETEQPEKSDPLILNLDNSDFNFSPTDKVSFDLNADGRLDEISNLRTGNAFLALDKNSNGLIDDGSELFGDTRGAADGFADLAQYDSNFDGQINADDKVFEHLLLMNFDAQGNQTIRKLSSEEIQSLSLIYQSKNNDYTGDNSLILESSFQKIDGSKGRVGDFLLSI